MRLRTPRFAEDVTKLTDKELSRLCNSKYVVNHSDGFEQGLGWNSTDKNDSLLFNSYSEAMDYSTKGSQILQTY